MFGSDWPVCLLAASYARVVGAVAPVLAGLPAADRSAVLGGTARAWYRLPDQQAVPPAAPDGRDAGPAPDHRDARPTAPVSGAASGHPAGRGPGGGGR
jgi:Amidohydrolase